MNPYTGELKSLAELTEEEKEMFIPVEGEAENWQAGELLNKGGKVDLEDGSPLAEMARKETEKAYKADQKQGKKKAKRKEAKKTKKKNRRN
jgi:hypothetical protein